MSDGVAPLALGTVQFGLAYGIAGRSEPVPPADARAILEDAAAHGVRLLDTAPAYGDIESRLADLCEGLPFDIVSKISPLPSDTQDAVDAVTQSIERSRERLGARLVALLFHRHEDLLGPAADRIWSAAAGAAGEVPVGVSGYGPGDVIEVRRRFPVRVAQIPGNALDQRLAAPATADALAGVEIHLRSVFLQGLLLMSTAAAARRVPASAEPHARWRAWCDAKAIAPATAALGAAAALPGVRHRLVGVDSFAQWREVCDAATKPGAGLAPELACADPDVIDPRRWPH